MPFMTGSPLLWNIVDAALRAGEVAGKLAAGVGQIGSLAGYGIAGATAVAAPIVVLNAAWNALGGNNIGGDFARMVHTNPYDDNWAYPDSGVKVCDRLPQGIKDAIIQAHMILPAGIPEVCANSDGTGVKKWQCDKKYVQDRQNDIMNVQNAINDLLCQLRGQQDKLEQQERALAGCVDKLDYENQNCLNSNLTSCEKKTPKKKKKTTKKTKKSIFEQYVPGWKKLSAAQKKKWKDYYNAALASAEEIN